MHINLRCPFWRAIKQPLWEVVSTEQVEAWPQISKSCGLIPELPDIQSFYARSPALVGPTSPPPYCAGADRAVEWLDERGRVQIAGDGACKNVFDTRLNSVFLGGSSLAATTHTTPAGPSQGRSQNAQRATLRTMLGWIQRIWRQSTYRTDSNCVHSGFHLLREGKLRKPADVLSRTSGLALSAPTLPTEALTCSK